MEKTPGATLKDDSGKKTEINFKEEPKNTQQKVPPNKIIVLYFFTILWIVCLSFLGYIYYKNNDSGRLSFDSFLALIGMLIVTVIYVLILIMYFAISIAVSKKQKKK